MRRLLASALAAVMLTLGVPVVGTANGTVAGVAGQLVDAGGRGSAATPVELVKSGAVISSTVTSTNGTFTFSGVTPGTYVVRATVNAQVVGVQVSLRAGETAPVLVVLPSVVTAAAQFQFASLLSSLGTTLGTTAMAAVVQPLATAAQADADEGEVEEAIQTQATLQVLVNALTTANVAQLNPQQLIAVATAISQITVSVPQNAPSTLVDTVQTFINTVNTVVVPITGGTPITVPTPRGPIVSTGSGTT